MKRPRSRPRLYWFRLMTPYNRPDVSAWIHLWSISSTKRESSSSSSSGSSINRANRMGEWVNASPPLTILLPICHLLATQTYLVVGLGSTALLEGGSWGWLEIGGCVLLPRCEEWQEERWAIMFSGFPRSLYPQYDEEIYVVCLERKLKYERVGFWGGPLRPLLNSPIP